MKKKLTALFLSVVMVLSVMTAAFAEDDPAAGTDPDTTGGTDDDLTSAAQGSTDVDSCVEKLKARFPRTGPLKIKIACNRVAAIDPEKKEEIQERIEEARENIAEKKEAIRERVKETAFGQEVSACMQDLLKAQPNMLKSEAAKKCAIKHKAAAGELVNAQKLRVEERLEECEDDACTDALQARLDRIDKLTEAAKNRISKIEEKRLERLKELKRFQIKSKIKAANNFRARSIAKLKLTEARARYAKAKVNFAEARERFLVTKAKFAAAAKLKEACDTDPESDECKQAQEEILAASKEHLLHVVDVLVEHLNKVKEHIESNEYLDEETAKDAVGKVDTYTAELESVKAEIEAAETKEDLKAATTKLKEEWKSIKVLGGSFAGRSINARIGGIIVKSKHLEVKLEKILSRMEEEGIDTTAVSVLVDSFHTHTEEAKAKHEEAVAKYKEAEETRSKETLEEAKALMKEAREALANANKDLKEIFAALKDQAREILADETIDDELEEELQSGGDEPEDTASAAT